MYGGATSRTSSNTDLTPIATDGVDGNGGEGCGFGSETVNEQQELTTSVEAADDDVGRRSVSDEASSTGEVARQESGRRYQ
jgi:hypothetical protein